MDTEFKPFTFGVLSAHLDIASSSGFHFSPANFTKTDNDYTLLNGRLTLSDIALGNTGKLKVAVWGKNLTDKEYSVFGIESTMTTALAYGEPRSDGIDIAYEY